MTAEIVKFPAPKAQARSDRSERIIEILEDGLKRSKAEGKGSADLDIRAKAEELHEDILSNIMEIQRLDWEERGLTPEWATAVIEMERTYERNFHASWTARHARLDELLERGNIVKPVFVSEGYEGINTTEARRVIWCCLPEIGEAEHKLIVSLKKHDWAHKKWRSRRTKAKQTAKRETHYDGPQPGPGEFSVACEVLGITAKEGMTDAKVAP